MHYVWPMAGNVAHILAPPRNRTLCLRHVKTTWDTGIPPREKVICRTCARRAG